MERALRARTPADAWAQLEPLRGEIERDREVAIAWATLAGASPSQPRVRADLSQIGARWSGDVEVLAALTDALLRLDERRPIDEPPPLEAPAIECVDVATRALSLVPHGELRAALLAARGGARARLRRDAEALDDLREAARLAPDDLAPLRALALARELAARFSDALEALSQLRARGEATRGVLFELAIAATACARSDVAVGAWRALGVQAEARAGSWPSVDDLPALQVRVPTRGAGHTLDTWLPDEGVGFERVWVRPLSPCHGVVSSPTFREARADHGDVILFDGAPVAILPGEGAERVPVMPFLALLRPGEEHRFRFLALEQREGLVAELAERLPAGVTLHRHAARVETVCPRCAAGEVLTRHEHLPAEPHRGVIGKLVVDPSSSLELARDALDAARAAVPGVLLAVPGLYEALRDTATAGRDHKRWGAIERGLTVRRGSA